MADELLDYYERELIYLRRLGAAFGERYPKVAARLQLEAGKCDDPHVERLLEGVAFLAARIHLRLDDDFPEITEALLNVVYPHALRPLPSLALVQLELDPEAGKLTTGYTVPRETPLHTRPVRGLAARFRTCYDTTLWPIGVEAAAWQSPEQLRPAVRAPAGGPIVAAVRVLLRCRGDATFAQLDLERLRFHLAGEAGLVYPLYELLASRCRRIVVREPGEGPGRRSIELPPSALVPVGFGRDEGLLPFPRRSFVGYQQLLEYFAFPEKYLFFDLQGLDALCRAGFGPEAEVLFLLAPFERAERRQTLAAGVTADTFRLGCTPVVNLFPRTSEPVVLTHQQHEYPVVPDARQRTIEAFSVEEVVGVTPGAAEPLRFEPFYAHRHAGADGSGGRAPSLFWTARRRPTPWRRDGGTELLLTFVDRAARFARPDLDAVTVRLLCHNGDLPSRLPFGADATDFELPSGGPVRRIVALTKPTPVVQPANDRGRLWRLVSQLSLNYLSLAEDGLPTLRELLRLHDVAGTPAAERQLQGLVAVRSRPAYARVVSDEGLAFARGLRLELELDEEQFAGAGAYLFAAVLERFFGLYVSMNSFTQLAVRSRQRKEPLHEWAPRAGARVLA